MQYNDAHVYDKVLQHFAFFLNTDWGNNFSVISLNWQKVSNQYILKYTLYILIKCVNVFFLPFKFVMMDTG